MRVIKKDGIGTKAKSVRHMHDKRGKNCKIKQDISQLNPKPWHWPSRKMTFTYSDSPSFTISFPKNACMRYILTPRQFCCLESSLKSIYTNVIAIWYSAENRTSQPMKQKSVESNKKVSNLRSKGLLVITENRNPSRLENETQKIMEKGIRRWEKRYKWATRKCESFHSIE